MGYGEALDLIEADRKETKLLVEVATRLHDRIIEGNSELKIVIINHVKYDSMIQKITAESLKTFAETNGISYLEFSQDYLIDNQDLYTAKGPHFSASGYRSIGEAIYFWLNKGNINRFY